MSIMLRCVADTYSYQKIPKMFGAPRWYRLIKIRGLAHGLLLPFPLINMDVKKVEIDEGECLEGGKDEDEC